MTKKSKKKETLKVIEEIQSYKYEPATEDEKEKAKADELLVNNEIQQKQIKKIEEIATFLEQQGLGQNARRRVFVLFEELRKLKCPKKHIGQ